MKKITELTAELAAPAIAEQGAAAPLRRDFFAKPPVSTGFLRKNTCVPCIFMVCYACK